MRTLVTMHQPNYVPWIGFFSKVAQSSCLVLMDTFQYTKDGIIHRNKIRTNTGTGYLTIPISKDFSRAKIKDVELPSDRKWQAVHWQTIFHNYVKTDYFKDYSDFFQTTFERPYQYLSQLNMDIIHYLLTCFAIDVEVIVASDLKVNPDLKHTDMITAVLKEIGATTFLSGPSGKGYLEIDKFRDNGLSCRFAQFTHPVYRQRYPGFEANMSAIDLLFNTGPHAGEIIRNSGCLEE
jgi:hypothetical protein